MWLEGVHKCEAKGQNIGQNNAPQTLVASLQL